jgi:hypothetical protein
MLNVAYFIVMLGVIMLSVLAPYPGTLGAFRGSTQVGSNVTRIYIGLGWKGLKGTKALAYLTLLISDKEPKVYDIDTTCQCYKTFFISYQPSQIS